MLRVRLNGHSIVIMLRVRLNDHSSLSNTRNWVCLLFGGGRDRARDEEARGLRQEAGQLRELLENEIMLCVRLDDQSSVPNTTRVCPTPERGVFTGVVGRDRARDEEARGRSTARCCRTKSCCSFV